MHYRSYQEAKSDLEKYPYFAYAAICAARLAPSEEEAEHMRMLGALNISATAAPELSHNPGNSYGGESGDADIQIPTTPGTADAIDAFLSRYAPGSGRELPPPPYSPGESMPMETMHDSADTQPHNHDIPEDRVRILIKNRKYADALAIIEDLNLKNPEKSIYFADQIRFLKKLIIIQTKANG